MNPFLILIILIACFIILYLLIKQAQNTDDMINLSLSFSVNEAIALFRNAGLEVRMHDFPTYLENPHGDCGTETMLPMWVVVNPHTGTIERLEDYFRKYLELKKQDLFLTPGKLEIYGLFENKIITHIPTTDVGYENINLCKSV